MSKCNKVGGCNSHMMQHVVTNADQGCPSISATPFEGDGPYPNVETILGAEIIGGQFPYTSVLASGVLPGSMVILDTPLGFDQYVGLQGSAPAGTYNFELLITDVNGCTGLQAFTVVVQCPVDIWQPTPFPEAYLWKDVDGVESWETVDEEIICFSAGAKTYSLVSGVLPHGWALVEDAGHWYIRGEAKFFGIFPITIQCTNLDTGCTSQNTYTIEIWKRTTNNTPKVLVPGDFTMLINVTGLGVTMGASGGAKVHSLHIEANGLNLPGGYIALQAPFNILQWFGSANDLVGTQLVGTQFENNPSLPIISSSSPPYKSTYTDHSFGAFTFDGWLNGGNADGGWSLAIGGDMGTITQGEITLRPIL